MNSLFTGIAMLMISLNPSISQDETSKFNTEGVTLSKGIGVTTDLSEISAMDATKKPKKEKKKKEVKYNEKGEIIKTGTNFGPLPVVAFDNDRGFQFGALLNLYNFGDGSTYPNPKSSWYFEASAYVKEGRIGTQNYNIEYDNKEIFKNIRMSASILCRKDDALDFYGFNGYKSNYYMPSASKALEEGERILNDEFTSFQFTDDKQGDKMLKKFNKNQNLSKGFYRHSRMMVRAKVDFTGQILPHFFWEAGYHFHWFDIDRFNPTGYKIFSSDDENLMRDYSLNLYDLYQEWGIIPNDGGKKYTSGNQANGGFSSALRAGLVYDSRDVESAPSKGIWADLHFIMAPKFLGTTHPYYRMSATFRHYVPIWQDKLVFAYRLTYQGFFNRNCPWYMMPFYTYMGKNSDYDGVGGYRSVRGLMMNRVVGPHELFGNLEFRYRFVDFKLWNQNIAFSITAFCDGGSVLGRGFDMKNNDYIQNKLQEEGKSEEYIQESLRLYNHYVVSDRKYDGFHGAAGAGLRFIMNKNFIVAFEYAQNFNKQDGNGAFYINIGYLF